MEREEEARQWRLFAASEYRSWEEWAISAELQGGPVKRARVQILVQGLGGRIVRDVNWLIPIRDGEQLSYAVRVRPANVQEDEDEEPHPEAASSTLHVPALAPVAAVETDQGEESDGGRSTLPVTGWESAPVMEEQELLAKDLDVATFVQCPLGIKFYRDWLAGKATCRLIGQRFGNGVLGKFYAIRDESERLRQQGDLSQEEAEHLARAAMAEATAQVVESGSGCGELESGEGSVDPLAMHAAGCVEEGCASLAASTVEDVLRADGLGPAAATTVAAADEDVPRADGLDPPAVDQHCDVHEQMMGVLDEHEAAGMSAVGVSFSDVLASLDEVGTEVLEEVPEGPRATGSVTSEGGTRQTDLSHWLK